MKALAIWAGILVMVLSFGCGGGGGGSSVEDEVLPSDTKGLEILGRGTDVFEEYAVESNVKAQVIDTEALNRDGLLVLNNYVEERMYEGIVGNEINEYASNLSATVGLEGSYMFFSASIQSSFTNDTYRTTDYSYATIMETNWKHSIKVQNDRWNSDYLKQHLVSSAKLAINNTDPVKDWSPEEIINSYGTHVMVGIYIGARLDYSLSAMVLEEGDRTQFDAYATAKYKSTFASASIEASMSTEEMNNYSSSEERVVIKSKGGDSQYANPADDDDYNAWHASISTNPVFCGIIKNALIPVWEFADDEQRRNDLEAYFYEYASGKDSEYLPLAKKITDIKMIDTGDSTNASLEQGYKLIKNLSGESSSGFINANIWHGTGRGDYIWLAYKDELTDIPGIAEIHVASNDASVNQSIFGALTHDDLYGVNADGCLANQSINMNADTCAEGYNNEYYSGWCAYWFWNPKCLAWNDLILNLHYAKEDIDKKATKCVVLGDYIAVNANQDLATRMNHIYWGPEDVNNDGEVNENDAAYVLDHVQWLRHKADGKLLNLNMNTQSYHVWDWYDCGFDEGWDDGWIHAYEAEIDAQYIGYCVD